MKVVISSGHGKYIRGAAGPEPWGLDEVDEARKVVEQVASVLRAAGVGVDTYHDDVSHEQSENLHRIVDYHNSRSRDLDASIHFNAYEVTSKPMGCEVLYVSQAGMEVADEVVDAICDASGLINRGPKKRTDLYFLNNTAETSILIETAFVDSSADADIYRENFNVICNAIAGAIAGEQDIAPPRPDDPLLQVSGPCSWFGGPDDTGVSPSEGLAFIYSYEQRPDLFLPQQPYGTTGLARRLDPDVFYVACRWDYSDTPKDMLADEGTMALVRAGGRELLAWPADWGPHEDTGRVADISPGLMAALGIDTDDEVEVIYPAPADVPIEPVEPVEPITVKIEITANGPCTITVNGQEFVVG
jgi:N-acetylmuramoyl-L-alanine amidase